VWKILIFEWILLLEIQKNCKKLCLELKKSVQPSMCCSHCQIYLDIFNSENVKNKECVHTWANETGYTSDNGKLLQWNLSLHMSNGKRGFQSSCCQKAAWNGESPCWLWC
jgi:hypothetical protein